MADSKELQELFHSCMPLFIALGDEVRLNIIEALCIASQNGHTEGLNVNEITRQTNLSRPAISHHLKIMKSCGLVEVTQSGTSNHSRYYTPKGVQIYEKQRTFLHAKRLQTGGRP